MARAEAHEHEAALARDAAARFGLAGITEKRVATELAPLSALGYHLLPDRAWPGSRSAQVDLIVVGPSGVHIVDTKAWKEVSIHEGRVSAPSLGVPDRFKRMWSTQRSGSVGATLTVTSEWAVQHHRRRRRPRGACMSCNPRHTFRFHASRLGWDLTESFGEFCMGAGMLEPFVSADDIAYRIGRPQDANSTPIANKGIPSHNAGRLLIKRPGAVGRGVRGNAAADEDA